jgi:hypothetical protein
MRASLSVLLLALAPLSAAAQIAPRPPATRPPVGAVRLAPRESTVDEITIMPRAVCRSPKKDPDVPPPKIVSTFPGPDDVVRPGVVVVRVTFDRPMSCDGFFFTDKVLDRSTDTLFEKACPDGVQDLLLSLDRLTIRTVCHLRAVSRYSLWMNDRPASGPRLNLTNQFISLAGWPVDPYQLNFFTNNGRPVRTIREALHEDPHPGIPGFDP